jgi:hypothetical protein
VELHDLRPTKVLSSPSIALPTAAFTAARWRNPLLLINSSRHRFDLLPKALRIVCQSLPALFALMPKGTVTDFLWSMIWCWLSINTWSFGSSKNCIKRR